MLKDQTNIPDENITILPGAVSVAGNDINNPNSVKWDY
jgi:hypothetical protein